MLKFSRIPYVDFVKFILDDSSIILVTTMITVIDPNWGMHKRQKDTYSGKAANLSKGIRSGLKAPWLGGCTNSAFNFPDWEHWLFYLICCRAKPGNLTLKVTEWKATRVLLLLEGT